MPVARGAVVRLLDDRLDQRDEDRAQPPLLSDRRAEVERVPPPSRRSAGEISRDSECGQHARVGVGLEDRLGGRVDGGALALVARHRRLERLAAAFGSGGTPISARRLLGMLRMSRPRRRPACRSTRRRPPSCGRKRRRRTAPARGAWRRPRTRSPRRPGSSSRATRPRPAMRRSGARRPTCRNRRAASSSWLGQAGAGPPGRTAGPRRSRSRLDRVAQKIGLDARREHRAVPFEDRRDREAGGLAGLRRRDDERRLPRLGGNQAADRGAQRDAPRRCARHAERREIARLRPATPSAGSPAVAPRWRGRRTWSATANAAPTQGAGGEQRDIHPERARQALRASRRPRQLADRPSGRAAAVRRPGRSLDGERVANAPPNSQAREAAGEPQQQACEQRAGRAGRGDQLERGGSRRDRALPSLVPAAGPVEHAPSVSTMRHLDRTQPVLDEEAPRRRPSTARRRRRARAAGRPRPTVRPRSSRVRATLSGTWR